ncbi:MAG: lysophospholipase [Spirochaetaceae bacterium]|nr:lysophospholipase [Spirochaetaceae bacterium]
MTAQEVWLETAGAVKLFTRRWQPEGSPRAIVNIVHGMAEHGARYARLAEALCRRGVEVWCADQRGHGRTADAAVNRESDGGLLGHCADRDAVNKVLGDIDLVHKAIRREYENIPLVLLGHSWGSFVVQAYIEFYGGPINAVILSGTRGTAGADIKAGTLILRLHTAVFPIRTKSQAIRRLVMGRNIKPFLPARTALDWLSRDQAEVDAYIADPLCGLLPTIGFYYDMLCLLKLVTKNRNIEKIRRDIPVYVFAGDRDPVGAMGAGVTALVKKYKNIGIKDLSFVLYPGARHECLNEINREEVISNLVAWIERLL